MEAHGQGSQGSSGVRDQCSCLSVEAEAGWVVCVVWCPGARPPSEASVAQVFLFSFNLVWCGTKPWPRGHAGGRPAACPLSGARLGRPWPWLRAAGLWPLIQVWPGPGSSPLCVHPGPGPIAADSPRSRQSLPEMGGDKSLITDRQGFTYF